MADTSNSVLFDAPGPKGRRTIRIVNWIAALIFVAVLVLVLMRLHNPPDGENQLSWELWKPAVEREAWTDFYLPGLWMTIKATVLAVVGAVVFGLVFGVGRLLPNPLVRGISTVIVEFCRAVPVLLLMIFFWRWFAFAGLPSPSYWAVVLALVLYNGSVVAELVRSGVGNLPGGQREASLALGLTETQSLIQIEVPQAVYAMLPAAVTQLVVVLKDTALGSIIMYTDLLQESRRLGSMTSTSCRRWSWPRSCTSSSAGCCRVWPNGCRRACSSAPRRRPNRNQFRRSRSWIRPTSTRSPSPRRSRSAPCAARRSHTTRTIAAATPRSTTGSARATSRASTRPIPIRRAEMRAMPSRRTLKTTRNDPVDYGPRRNTRTASHSLTR